MTRPNLDLDYAAFRPNPRISCKNGHAISSRLRNPARFCPTPIRRMSGTSTRLTEQLKRRWRDWRQRASPFKDISAIFNRKSLAMRAGALFFALSFNRAIRSISGPGDNAHPLGNLVATNDIQHQRRNQHGSNHMRIPGSWAIRRRVLEASSSNFFLPPAMARLASSLEV